MRTFEGQLWSGPREIEIEQCAVEISIEQCRIAHRHELDSRIGNNFFFSKKRIAVRPDKSHRTRHSGVLTVDRHSQRRRRRVVGIIEDQIPLVAIYARRTEVLKKYKIAMEPARRDRIGQDALSLSRILAP